jgi:hypothetical protein
MPSLASRDRLLQQAMSEKSAVAPFARVDPDQLCMGCFGQRDGAVCRGCGWSDAASVSPLHLPPRTVLNGQYLVGRALGQGGFGITYLAWDLHLEMRVAIKEFLPTDFASRASGEVRVVPYGEDGHENFEYGLESFEAEARSLARFFELPGVVPVHNYFQENGTGYIVMPFLEGGTLKDRLRDSGGRIASDEAVQYIAPLLETLTAIHATGLLHRDISPDNIYVCDSGRVCLLDFGAARNAVRQRSRSLSVQFKPGYTPEEQFRRRGAQGPWTDVYAVSATLYRAITGVVPQSALDRLQEDHVVRPSALVATVPPQIDAAIMRGLALRAERRFQSVKEFATALGIDRVRAAAPEQRPQGSEATGLSAAGLPVWRQQIAAFGDWCRVVTSQLGAAILAQTEALAARTTGAPRERAVRERLAAIAPIIVVDLKLRGAHLPAGTDENQRDDVYARDDTREVAFDVTLQNTLAGIKSVHGMLGVAYIEPGGTVSRRPDSPAHLSFALAVDIADRAAFAGSWGGGRAPWFRSGHWRVELWWDGRKIGDRPFVVSE